MGGRRLRGRGLGRVPTRCIGGVRGTARYPLVRGDLASEARSAPPARGRRRCCSRSAPRSPACRRRELDPAQPLGALPEVLAGDDEAQRPAVLRRQRLAVGVRHEQRVASLKERERHVRREALLGVRDREARARFRRQSFASSLQWTPSNCASKRLQRVTQWMSCVTSTRGSALNCSQVSSSSSSTSPKTRSVQVARSVVRAPRPRAARATSRSGTGPAAAAPGRSPASRTFFSALDRNIATYTSP